MVPVRQFARAVLACFSVVLVLGLLPSAALADGPATTPMTIMTDGFEAAPSSTWWEIREQKLTLDSLAYWGRMSNIKRTGTYSLWCAGFQYTLVNGVRQPKVPPAWGKYLSRTQGRAIVNLDVLQDYYYSEFEFYYNMPSIGMADKASFATGWSDGVNTFADHSSNYPLTASTGWVKAHHVLSSESNTNNLSRSTGYAYFNFYDTTEGPWQSVKTGQGPSIDDVRLVGYKYGPVRSLSASGTGSGVELVWSVPARAIGDTSPETRTVGYRVWRAPDGQGVPVWTELTPAAISSTSFSDSGAAQGITYRYAVQVTDASGGYGTHSEAVGRRLADGIDLAVSAPNGVLTGSSITATYTVTNTGATTIPSVALVDNWSGTQALPPITSLAPGTSATITRLTPALASNTTINVTATASGGLSAAGSRLVTVYAPKVSVSVTPSLSKVIEGVPFTLSYSIKNEGNTPLTDVVLSDGLGGTVLGGTSALAAGQTQVQSITVTQTVSGTRGAYVSAAYAVPPDLTGSVSGAGTSGTIQVLSSVPSASRIAGNTRILTAVSISTQSFPGGLDGVKAAVLANSGAWADALPASALAGAARGPLLLTDAKAIDSAVLSELARLGAKKVYVVGGTSVIGAEVESTLKAKGYVVARLGGGNRFATARLIAAEVGRVTGSTTGGDVFLATGANFPDALAASSLAARMGAPILLTEQGRLPSDTDAALAALQPDRVIICGGSGVVSDSVAQSVYASKYGKPTVVRKGGGDRYQTAQLVIEYGRDKLIGSSPKGIFIATGSNYPDALAGGVLAGAAAADWRPLMLTTPGALSPEARAIISATPSIDFGCILGGEGAVSGSVASQLSAAVSAN